MNCFIIAEAGVNHNGSLETALRLVDTAAAAGADAVKFQTFSASRTVVAGGHKADYQMQATGEGDQLAMLRALELPRDWHEQLIAQCRELGIEFMSTGFDAASVDFLVGLGVRRLKSPSGELTNPHYLGHLAEKNLPIILSTGMGTLEEVVEAVEVIRDKREQLGLCGPLAESLTLLHCTSNYPTELKDVNLRAMETMAAEFGLPVGYSDHTAGILIPPLAVALGAAVIEKHFTLSRDMPGPDHKASLEPDELCRMIEAVRQAEKSLGDGVKAPMASELPVREVVRRSVTLARSVAAGQVLADDDLILLRPAGGIEPRDLEQVVGRRAATAMKEGHTLQWADLEP